jgi:anti-sigma regulatory factor (Ser/Thr protein kinase)
VLIRLSQSSDVGEVRRQAAAIAKPMGFGDEAAGRVSIVATELATNIIKHASAGEIVIEARESDQSVELLAIDRGPGMADLARCLEDGYSTAGSPGTGLGAMRRLSDATSIFSHPGQGSVIMARLTAGHKTPAAQNFEVGAVTVPCPGELVCGDAWALRRLDAGIRLLVVDGSGHGTPAAAAAEAAIQLFPKLDALPIAEGIATAHRGLGATRGAALALATIDGPARLVRFAGLGNISGVMIDGTARRGMVSTNGTAGHTWRAVKEFTYPFAGAEPIVILHSDGIATRWQLDPYPGLARCHASVIAGVLYRDFARGRDDATVVVVKAKIP